MKLKSIHEYIAEGRETKTEDGKTTTTIEKLKKKEVFRFIGGKSVYMYDGYNRETKKYSYYKADDISSFGEKKKGITVEIDFEY